VREHPPDSIEGLTSTFVRVTLAAGGTERWAGRQHLVECSWVPDLVLREGVRVTALTLGCIESAR
jgi:hypothetical protein